MRQAVLAKLLQENAEKGLYTHAYLEIGNFKTDCIDFTLQVSEDEATWFDLASLTKPLVTTHLVQKTLAEQGIPIKETLGDMTTSSFDFEVSKDVLRLTIEDLLSHHSGLPAWRNFYVNQMEIARAQPPRSQVLSRVYASLTTGQRIEVYSDLGFILLGEWLRVVHGQPLNRLAKSYFETLHPPGTKDIPLYRVDLDLDQSEFIRSGFCRVRARELKGEVYDENCFTLGGVAGHAGLFGTGKGLGTLFRCLMKSEEAQAIISQNIDRARSAYPLLGWRPGDDQASHLLYNGQAMGHYGFTGTSIWFSPADGSYTILLTNRTISGRISPYIRPFRAKVYSAC